MPLRILLAGLTAAMLMAGQTAADPARDPAADPERAAVEKQLQEAERRLSEAEAAQATKSAEAAAMAAEVATLREAVQKAARELRAHEQVILKRATELEQLKQKQAARQAEWQARRAEIGQSTSALIRLASIPPAAALLQDASATERLRSAFVLRGLLPRLQGRAGRIRQDLARLQDAAASVERARQALVSAKQTMEARLQEAEKLAERKNATLAVRQEEAAMAAAHANRQARSAQSIRELIARLDDARSARTAAMTAERNRRAAIAARAGTEVPRDPGLPLKLAGLEAKRGGLLLPITGSVSRGFGQGDGAFAEGVTLSATPGAPVLAPADGRIRYAGEFRDYGLVLIVDHGDGFHSVMIGFARVNVETDQWVLAGEPLGRVAPHGSLYIEIRHDGRPVDPLQWFTSG